jgi:uncharacterized protein YceH (UPF0502 family)
VRFLLPCQRLFLYINAMPSAGDPSLLRRLAVSFGEGLAFSVAMKLTENAMRPKAAAAALPPANVGPLADRLGRIEQRMQRLDAPRAATSAAPAPAAALTQAQIDQRVIQAIVGAVEKRLNEHASQVQQRIAGLESSVSANVQATAARRIEQETNALRAQVVTMQREFAQSVASIVAEQVAAQVAERTRAMEATIHAKIEAAVAPLRQEIHELRQRIAETDNTMGEFVSAISDTVRKASDRGVVVEEPERTVPVEAPRVVEPVPIRAHQPPEHLDLRVLRKRLREVDLPVRESRPGFLPLPATSQRRGPASLSQFRAAS